MRNSVTCCLGLCCLLLFCSAFSSSTIPQAEKGWWALEISVEVQGNYRISQDKPNYQGNYAFRILWTGDLQKDEEDFILYPRKATVENWEATETGQIDEDVLIKTTGDFVYSPKLSVNYLLKNEGAVLVDLAVDGFIVPQNPSSHKIDLLLPASRGHRSAFPQIRYDEHVMHGTNRIDLGPCIPEDVQLLKKFAWKWRIQKWISEQRKPVYFFHSHDVKMTITITPASLAPGSRRVL